MPVARSRNQLPLILGGAGGALVLIIVLIVALSGPGDGPKKKVEPPPAPVPEKPKPPDVSGLESEGKKKCEDGAKACDAKSSTLAGLPADQKEKVRGEVEAAVKLIDEGLACFKRATDIAGKKYDLDSFERSKAKALKKWSADIEAEADQACDEGLRIFKASQALFDARLNDADGQKLKVELLKAKKLLEHGNNLRERSQLLTGHQFETREAGQAYKLLKNKLLELK